MNYYHINKTDLTILSGPHAAQSDYVKRLTSCGNPELLDLSAYDLVPQVFPPLAEGNQYNGETTVFANRVEMGQELIPVAIPSQITMRQARLQLLTDGVLDQVNAAVQTMGQAAQIEWEYAAVVERGNPLIAAVQTLLGWDDARADQFFTAAATL